MVWKIPQNGKVTVSSKRQEKRFNGPFKSNSLRPNFPWAIGNNFFWLVKFGINFHIAGSVEMLVFWTRQNSNSLISNGLSRKRKSLPWILHSTLFSLILLPFFKLCIMSQSGQSARDVSFLGLPLHHFKDHHCYTKFDRFPYVEDSRWQLVFSLFWCPCSSSSVLIMFVS